MTLANILIVNAQPNLNSTKSNQTNTKPIAPAKEAPPENKTMENASTDETGYPLLVIAAITSIAVTGYIAYENRNPNNGFKL